jgi:hypothetical protein
MVLAMDSRVDPKVFTPQLLFRVAFLCRLARCRLLNRLTTELSFFCPTRNALSCRSVPQYDQSLARQGHRKRLAVDRGRGYMVHLDRRELARLA